MNSGTFHVSAQEWRYYSREKSLIHTLHLAELPSSRGGDTVLIMPVAPTSNPKGKGIPPLSLPSGPSFFTNVQQVTNNSMKITCYGSVGCDGTILAQSKMSITVGPIGGSLSRIIMSPEETGLFVVWASAYSDIHSFVYEGAGGDGQITLQIVNGGSLAAQAIGKIKMEGTQWSTDSDILRRMEARCSCLVPSAGSFTAFAFNLGNAADCCLSMWAMKVADYA